MASASGRDDDTCRSLALVLTVAIDEGPRHGPRTGVAVAADGLIGALEEGGRPIRLTPYLTSARARVTGRTQRLPLPAALAHRLWARMAWPPMDRFLGRPDVVHGTNYVVPPARCARVVSVYDCWFLDHPDEAVPDVRRAGAVLRRSVAEGAHVIASSEATAGRVRELLDTDAVTTIHLGAPDEPPVADGDAVPARLAALTTAPFVLSLGTLERRKNVPVLVAAFGRLAREHQTVKLVVAGAPGDDADAVHAALAALPGDVRSRILVTGRICETEKAWLLRRATVLAYPSLDEGFGFPVLEAQRVGTPVVASAAGSIPEVAGTGALLGLPGDRDALAANLYGVLVDPTRRAALVERGRTNVERFSWARTADAHLDLYERLAGSA